MTSLTMTVLSINSEAHLTVTGVRVISITEVKGGGGRRQITSSLTSTILSITSEAHLTVTGVGAVWIVACRVRRTLVKRSLAYICKKIIFCHM